MKKTILAVLATAALTLGAAKGVQITGDIDFAGQAIFNTHSLATATQVTNFMTKIGGLSHSALVDGRERQLSQHDIYLAI